MLIMFFALEFCVLIMFLCVRVLCAHYVFVR